MSTHDDRRRTAELRGAYHAGTGQDRHLKDAYDQGRKDVAPTEPAAPAKPAATKPAQTRPARRRARTPGYVQRAFSPRAAGARVARTAPGRVVARSVGAGDSGGLLLALVVYPIVLATVRYGADGPVRWFRAKWLNETTDKNGNASSSLPGTLPAGAAAGIGAAIGGALGQAPRHPARKKPAAHGKQGGSAYPTSFTYGPVA